MSGCFSLHGTLKAFLLNNGFRFRLTRAPHIIVWAQVPLCFAFSLLLRTAQNDIIGWPGGFLMWTMRATRMTHMMCLWLWRPQLSAIWGWTLQCQPVNPTQRYNVILHDMFLIVGYTGITVAMLDKDIKTLCVFWLRLVCYLFVDSSFDVAIEDRILDWDCLTVSDSD